MTTGYEIPAFDDLAGQLAAEKAKVAAVRALIETHTKKDGRVPVSKLRTAIGACHCERGYECMDCRRRRAAIGGAR